MSERLRERLVVLAHRAGGQRELAESLGVNQGTVSRVINGQPLTPHMARLLAEKFPDLRPLVAAAVLEQFLGEEAGAVPA